MVRGFQVAQLVMR